MIARGILALVPEGWTLTHLILLHDGCWQVNLEDEHNCVNATGDDIEGAFALVADKILHERDFGSKFRVSDHMENEEKGYMEAVARAALERRGLLKTKVMNNYRRR